MSREFGDPEDDDAIRKFRAYISKENLSMGQVIGVANATKHVIRLPKRKRVGYEDVYPQRMGCGQLRAGRPINDVQVIVIDVWQNKEFLVSQLIEASMAYWRQKLSIAA
jgi:hypothetical protein